MWVSGASSAETMPVANAVPPNKPRRIRLNGLVVWWHTARPVTHHELQCFALERFAHIAEFYKSCDDSWSTDERQFLEHALFSTYRDC